LRHRHLSFFGILVDSLKEGAILFSGVQFGK